MVSQLSGISSSGLSTVTLILQVVIFLHLLLAIANGGSFACFLRPIRNIRQLRKRVRSGEFSPAVNLWTERLATISQPWHHFVLAIKAVGGALCWLTIPTVLLGMSSTSPHEDPGLPGFLSFVGGALMIPVAAWLPLLQVHQATTGRFRAIFEVRVVREIISRVPIRWAIATILLYALCDTFISVQGCTAPR